jgi:cell division septation protein DedD
MAENRRGKDSRYFLSRGQMIILAGTFTLASVVIFFIGMMVGTVIEERKIFKKDEPLVKMPIKPAGAANGAAVKSDEITFYDTLAKSRSAQALAEAPAKELRPAVKAESPEEKAANSAKPDKPVAKLPESKTGKTQKETETAKGEPAGRAEGAVWRAQVDALPDERSAKLLVDRLKNKGYNAYVSEVELRGKTWYRVSVGKYGSREEADKAVSVLKDKEDYSRAFAASK